MLRKATRVELRNVSPPFGCVDVPEANQAAGCRVHGGGEASSNLLKAELGRLLVS